MKHYLPFIVLLAITLSSMSSCQQTPMEIPVSSIFFTKSEVELTVGEQISIDPVITPNNATNKEVEWKSTNEEVASVSKEGVVKALKAGKTNITAITVDQAKTATYTVVVTSNKLFPSLSLVNLGLSVKWASCNLGASKPTEYGGYYQWAGTKDVSDTSIYLDLNNCPYHTGSDKYSGWSKYNTKSSYGTVDNKTVLEAKDDAVTVALGGNWRIPTDEEWAELIANCSWTWTTIDGVSGYKVQSKKSGYTDKWIFLPAAGCRYYDFLSDVGSYGRYWSSSLYTDYPYYACTMYFRSSDVSRSSDDRCSGQSVLSQNKKGRLSLPL